MAVNHCVCIIMLGESGVGKTSLLKRFCKNTFDEVRNPTTEADLYSATVTLDNKTIGLKLWDTAGQEIYRSQTQQYFRQADGVVLAYDMTNHATFTELSSWLRLLREKNEEATVLIVGTKADLRHQHRVSAEIAEGYARSVELEFVETSAKDNENVDEVFEKLARKVLERKKIPPFYKETSNDETNPKRLNNAVSTSTQTNTDLIDLTKPKKNEKKGCC